MSTPLVHYIGRAALMLEDGVDTDVIFPARFLLQMDKEGLGQFLFADRRAAYSADAAESFAFPLEGERPAMILAGAAFGSGSSREHAAWALADYGIRAVIAPDFGEIFASNAPRSGLAALRLDAQAIAALAEQVTDGELAIDLEAKTLIAPDGTVYQVDLPEQDRLSLINGWDQIDMIDAMHGADIDAFEEAYRQRRQWAIPAVEDFA